jgi:hypothetical protein
MKGKKGAAIIAKIGYWEEPSASNYMPRRIGAQ